MIDEARTREFGRALVGMYSGAALTYLIGVGHEKQLQPLGEGRSGVRAEDASVAWVMRLASSCVNDHCWTAGSSWVKNASASATHWSKTPGSPRSAAPR
jgi:hypothetical protein